MVLALSFIASILQISTPVLAFLYQKNPIKTNFAKKRNDILNMKMKPLIGRSEEGHQLESQRRDFLRNGLSLLISSATVISSAGRAEASGTGGYIPDMVGGLKKPKGVGGLTKKIRKVGNIMVRNLFINTASHMPCNPEWNYS